jgi:myo-inositol-1(or 4)-monophosphatase
VGTPGGGELLLLAAGVARQAAARLRDGRDGMSERVDTKSSPTDVVTAMDRAAEEFIATRLLAARPDDGLLGEEGGQPREGSSGVRWIVDPIDGTVNYLYRLPQWSVCIAAEVGGRILAGVVHDGARDESWQAVLGAGATRDGRPVHCSTVTELSGALVGTGFGYDAAHRARQARVLAEVLPLVRDIRRLGSAALDLCNVAAGVLDAYYEQGLQPWDLAAGGLVAAEAGCRVAGLGGAPAGERLVIAAPPALFDPLEGLLAGLRADRRPGED